MRVETAIKNLRKAIKKEEDQQKHSHKGCEKCPYYKSKYGSNWGGYFGCTLKLLTHYLNEYDTAE